MTDHMSSCNGCEAQLAEIEMMEAAYGDSFKLVEGSLPHEIAFDITVESLSMRLYVPANYPTLPVRFIINSAYKLSNSEKIKISKAIEQAGENVVLGCMEICQMAIDLCLEHADRGACSLICSPVHDVQCKKRMARFLIFFHHIMSGKKRLSIVEHARDLGLGGYSKHGFPGIVIVEGFDYDVLEYVRRIQHLRWQQMVVRGEEFDEYVPESGEQVFERKFPVPFREIEGDSMSDIASLCQDAGCRELFMTSMKKY